MRVRLRLDRLKQLLAASPLTQNHWALKIGLSRGHWSDLVNGRHPYPSTKTRQRMLEEFGVPLEDLFEIDSGVTNPGDIDFRRAIADRYIIDRELGQGGMGAVYLARDVRHGRVVAVKVISPEAVSGIGLNQFHREISTVAQLHHPNILPLFDSGDAAGHPFYVMPYVRGGSLRARLQRDVRFDLASVVRLTRGMAEALHAAHGERVLHCDVKPENVLLHNDHAWVMDFGIARKLHSEIGDWPLRKELDISAGTPAYVSPEQASGDPDLDARSDVYSLGCIVYEMLAGRTPFGGTSTQEIVATRFIVPPPPLREYAPEVPLGIVSLLERAMAVPRNHRPESAEAFVAEIEQAAANSSRVLAAASVTTSRAINRARRHFKRAPARSLGGIVRSIAQDTKSAGRALFNRPGFATAAILTLALGIGSSSAIFSVVNGVLLKPLPFPQSQELVDVRHFTPTSPQFPVRNHSPATYWTAHDNQRAFESIGAWESNDVTITGTGDPERVNGLFVTHETPTLLRVQTALGRLFSAADDRPGSPLRAILTHGFWQRRFGNENAIGKTLTIDGEMAEVIGVLPASFRFLRQDPAIVLPMRLDPTDRDGGFDFQAIARLKDGVRLEQASADMSSWLVHLPPGMAGMKLQPHLRPLAASVIGDVGRVLWILQAVAVVVLLIACGNVTNLFLIRAEKRQQEFAVRAALGASRARLARAILSESVLLAVGGGVLGLVLARLATDVLRRIAPAELPRIDEIGIDLWVVFFTFTVSLLSGLLFGVIAVLKVGKPSTAALKEGGRSSSDGVTRNRTRNALVVLQLAMALTLMLVSGLMGRTFMAMRQVDPGFVEPEEVQTFRVATPPGIISDRQEIARTHEQIRERLTRIAGVTSVGISSSITLDGEDNGNAMEVEEFPPVPGAPWQLRRFKSYAPGYFETMGNRMVAGRSITWHEIHEQRPVIVVSERFARDYWTNPDQAIGKRVRGADEESWRQIVGVVGDERDDGLNQPATAMVYWPLLNGYYGREAMAYAVRSSRVGTTAFMDEIRKAVWSVNANLPISEVQSLDTILDRSMAQTTFATTMLALAASVALLLGIVGIYSVIAYVVSQRTREIGIRMALGAQFADVRGMFLRHGLLLTSAGVTLGVIAALAFTRLMAALLFGVGPTDLVTYAVVTGALAAVAMLAMYVPARRATRVDPIIALRSDG